MIDSISYLRSIRPRYGLLVCFLFISFILIISFMFVFKSYDVIKTKGYVSCDDKCMISISVDYLNVNKYKNIDMIKINKDSIKVSNIDVSDIIIDESNKSNYQIVSLEVNQLDNGILNTFQDISLYSNYELIINKLINSLL